MKTTEILLGIKDSVLKNPTIMDDIDYRDIHEMVYLDIQCRRQLYSALQMKEVEEFFGNILGELSVSIERHNPVLFEKVLEDLLSHIKILPEAEYVSDFIEQANMSQLRLDHILRKTIYVIGDSHVNFFSGNEELSFIPAGNGINTAKQRSNLPFSVFHMGPCLAYNVNKYNTTYHFREKLEWLLDQIIESGAVIMFVLGWVDLRAHVIKHARLKRCSYMEIVDEIVDNYIHMMKDIARKGYKVLCFGPIGTLSEKTPTEISLSQAGSEVERNYATVYFTNKLMKLCDNEPITCLTVLDRLITDDMYTKTEYLCRDGCHLSQTIMPFVLDKLNNI